jgi:phosphate transport system substrate-binding protein
MKKFYTLIALLAITSTTYARDTISIVGSSTVFPYATIGAERFTEEGFNGATVEPTGTGGGMKLFCGGLGTKFPDITNASRL